MVEKLQKTITKELAKTLCDKAESAFLYHWSDRVKQVMFVHEGEVYYADMTIARIRVKDKYLNPVCSRYHE